jgi:hypothetical protein
MPNGAKIFISATSKGLRSYREIATDVVAAQGYLPVVQEHFPTPSDEITKQIQAKVSECQAVLGIVGPFYGATSTARDRATRSALSYSQYELKYALHRRRPCLVLIADAASEFAEADPEPDVYRQCQADFVASLKRMRDARLGWSPFSTPFEFALALAKVRWREWLNGG